MRRKSRRETPSQVRDQLGKRLSMAWVSDRRAGRWAGDPTRDYEYTTNRPGGQSESGRGKGLMSSFQCRMSIVTRSHRSSVRHEANHAREPVVRLFDPPLPEHVESSRAILPDDIDVGERPGIALARHCF